MAIIDEARQDFPVSLICRELDVVRSGYYAWRRQPSRHASARLLDQVKQIHAAARHCYGSRRMAAALREQGIVVGRYRTRTLMRQAGVQVRYPRPRYRRADQVGQVAPNRLNRQFQPADPNHVWAGDITYVATAAGWLYVAIVMDLFARRIIGWACSRRPDADLVVTALDRAWQARGKPAKVMFHSDQGIQYTSKAFTTYLKDRCFVQSMSRRGNCWDNAVVERFFRSLKSEGSVEHLADHTRAEHAVDDYMIFYNTERLHSSLGYANPVNADRI
jgi:putative transposase